MINMNYQKSLYEKKINQYWYKQYFEDVPCVTIHLDTDTGNVKIDEQKKTETI